MSAAGDRAVLDSWWASCRRRPGALPDGVDPVQGRLVRAVGRGVLPASGPVFVKVMGFARRKDRLRYLLRRLPAAREAALLRWVRQRGLRCPEVVAARGARRGPWPLASMLVTRALAVTAAPGPQELAAAFMALVRVGLFHPDLNPGNFVGTPDGVAVLDLQSARRRRPGLRAGSRVAMAGKLLAEQPAAAPALRAAGLAAAELARAEQLAEALRRDAPLRRIRRCLRESSEFAVHRRLRGTEYRRRALPEGGRWVAGGPELVELWLGDRTLEVLDGRAPRLGALFRKWRWFPGRYSVYLLQPDGHAVLPVEAPALQEGFDRYLEMKASRCPGTVTGARW